MTEIKIYNSSKQLLLFLMISLLFASGGLFLITQNKHVLTGYITLILSSLGFILFSYRLIFRSPQLILDDSGVTHFSNNKHKIKWDDLNDAWLTDFNSNTYLCLNFVNGRQPSEGYSTIKKEFQATLKELFGVTEITWMISTFDVKPQLLVELFLKMIHAREAKNRTEIIKHYYALFNRKNVPQKH